MIFPILLIVVLFIGIVLLGREWFKSQDEIKELQNEVTRLDSLNSLRQNGQDFWKAEHDKLSKEVDERNEVIDDLHARMVALRRDRDEKIDELTKERDDLRGRGADLETNVNRLENELFRANEVVNSRTNWAQRLDAAYKVASEELDSAKVEIEALRHELATAREFGDQLITVREKLRDALAAKRPNWKKLVEGLL